MDMPQTNQSPRIYPTFRYRNAVRMIDWLEKAFGFTVRVSYTEGGKVGHAELAFGSSMIMLGSVQDDHYGGSSANPGRRAARASMSQ
jgi:uncharacterized glyoxalase superfamily protein PhnB